MKQRGYILIARGLLSHPRFKPSGAFTNAEAWLWMIDAAAFKAYPVDIMAGRLRRRITLDRGQLSYSVRYLATAWRWSPGRVQRFLDDLQTDTSIDTQTDTGQTVISLCNYETYQAPTFQADTQTGTRSGTQTDTNKKEGIRKNDITRSRAAASDEDFAAWYAIYPRKGQPDFALKTYRKVITGGKITPADLMTRTAAFAGEWAGRLARVPDDKQYIPLASSWLNKGGYQDAGAPNSSKPSTPAPVKAAFDFSEADWRDCLSFRDRHNKWSAEWGPPPGAAGCLVPSHLIVTPVSTSQGAA